MEEVCGNCYWFLTSCNNCSCTMHHMEPDWPCENYEEFGAIFSPVNGKTFEQEADEWWGKYGEECLARMEEERTKTDETDPVIWDIWDGLDRLF